MSTAEPTFSSHGDRRAVMLYVANGHKWEKAIEDFVRWALHYDLWCKMRYFADDIRNESYRSERTGKRGPRNLLELLPDTFTTEDAARLRQKQGLDPQTTQQMIYTWKFRKYILQITDYSFEKVKYRNKTPTAS